MDEFKLISAEALLESFIEGDLDKSTFRQELKKLGMSSSEISRFLEVNLD